MAGAPAAVLLPPAAVRTHWLRSIPSDPVALRQSLASDPELRLPGVDGEAVHYALSVARDTPAANAGDAAASVAASGRKDAVKAYVAALAGPGLGTARASVHAVSLANLHSTLHPEEADGPVVILHGGVARSEAVVVQGGRPVVAFPVAVGVEALVEAVTRTHPEHASAELTALLVGGKGLGAAADSWVDRVFGPYRTATGAAMQRLTTGSQAARPVGSGSVPIRVCGGLARYRAAWERLGERAGVEIFALDGGARWPELSTDDVFGPALSSALGAALEARAFRLLEAR